jgi:hypothetical protein
MLNLLFGCNSLPLLLILVLKCRCTLAVMSPLGVLDKDTTISAFFQLLHVLPNDLACSTMSIYILSLAFALLIHNKLPLCLVRLSLLLPLSMIRKIWLLITVWHAHLMHPTHFLPSTTMMKLHHRTDLHGIHRTLHITVRLCNNNFSH